MIVTCCRTSLWSLHCGVGDEREEQWWRLAGRWGSGRLRLAQQKRHAKLTTELRRGMSLVALVDATIWVDSSLASCGKDSNRPESSLP